jgi:hypothetical protein
MKVWVVFRDNQGYYGEAADICGIFLTEAEATEAKQKLVDWVDWGKEDFCIEEMETGKLEYIHYRSAY